MKTTVRVLLSLMFAMLNSVFAEMRVWSDKKGNTVEAEFVSIFGSKAVLMTPDGKQLKVPVSGLCTADRAYLATVVPPKIKITVDLDKDRDTVASYSSSLGTYNSETKAETIKCTTTLEKTNREPTNRKFTARMYVIGQEITRPLHKILSYAEHSFSFEQSDVTEFRTSPATVEYTKSSYYTNEGYKYEGYLVVVEDEGGNVIALDASSGAYEKNLDRLRKAKVNNVLDDDFDVVNRR